MDAIEKRALELFDAARGFYNATIADPAVTIRCQSCAVRDAVAAAGERLRLPLLDQRPALIPADDLQVVTSSAPGAHEVQPEAVDVGLDLAELGKDAVAGDALEHVSEVRQEGDGQATADRSARDLETVERVAKAMQAAEQAQSGWTWQDCSPIEVEGWMDLARAAIAALAPPQGYVLVPVVPTKQMIDAAVPISSQDQTGRRQRASWDAMLAARPEVL
ncbi:hypothetical protein [Stenotrophomonas forensis]|uniref:hypothetical protein n=1 Tax=Stenotrophomonas forensis TaxID=2871169 RepID=UPI0039C6D2D2